MLGNRELMTELDKMTRMDSNNLKPSSEQL